MRQNLVPGITLQVIALLVALAYALWGPVRHYFDQVGLLKQQYGYGFSALSTALFGGVIPSAVLLTSGRLGSERRAATVCGFVLFWGYKGVEVDAFYRLQALLFGTGSNVLTITIKVVVDQFVYNPIWAGPSQVLFLLWKDSGFSWVTVRQRLKEQSLVARVAVVLVSTWMVWIPTVSIIYTLPPVLQIPLFNLVLCFWSLLVTTIGQNEAQRTKHANG